jgi:hypothetical protein
LAEDANFERISGADLGRAFTEESLVKVRLEAGSTIIKLFQDVPRADLEMLFPNAQVRMRRIDKLLIGVPALVSGIIVVVTKLIAALIPVVLLLAFWFGVRKETGPARPGPARRARRRPGGRGRFPVRQFNTFKNRKIQFMKSLSENLYFRNLDNDAGVRRLRLVDDDAQGRLTAVTLDEAKRRLDETWDDLFTYHASSRADAT